MAILEGDNYKIKHKRHLHERILRRAIGDKTDKKSLILRTREDAAENILLILISSY